MKMKKTMHLLISETINEKKGRIPRLTLDLNIYGIFNNEKSARDFIENNKKKDSRLKSAYINEYYINPKSIEWIIDENYTNI